MAIVVISGTVEGDRSSESPDVKASKREASNSAGCSNGEPISPENQFVVGAERFPVYAKARAKWKPEQSHEGPTGDAGDDTLRRNMQRKRGTTRGSPRRTCTAKASRISRRAVKSRCACEWGRWGRLSVDGSGQNNPNRSEGPWGRAATVARTAVRARVLLTDSVRFKQQDPRAHEGQTQTTRREGCARCRPNRIVVWEGAV
jgi:hypothetical protein